MFPFRALLLIVSTATTAAVVCVISARRVSIATTAAGCGFPVGTLLFRAAIAGPPPLFFRLFPLQPPSLVCVFYIGTSGFHCGNCRLLCGFRGDNRRGLFRLHCNNRRWLCVVFRSFSFGWYTALAPRPYTAPTLAGCVLAFRFLVLSSLLVTLSCSFFVFLPTRARPSHQMHQPILSALSVLRDETGTLTWFDFLRTLDVLTAKTITLGLIEDRTMLDLLRHRGNLLIRKNGDPRSVLLLFADMLPNHRRVPKSILKRDAETLKQMNKVAEKNLGKGGHGAQVAAAQQSFAAASSTTPALAYPGAVTLPLPSPASQGAAGAAGSAAPGSGRSGKGRRGGSSGGRQPGGGAAAAPPSVPSTQAAQARLDYNKLLQAKQQAMTSDPNGNVCRDCEKAGRTAHHYFKECAFSECYRCKRGGHRAPMCTFPKFP